MNTSAASIDRITFSIPEAASALGVCPRTIYSLMGSGNLRTIRIGRRRLIPRDELNRLGAEGSTEHAA
jgi:excisionase family DNA binding protein